MKRIPHILKKIVSCKLPSNFVFFDCETEGKENEEKPAESEHYLRFGIASACRYEDTKVTRTAKNIFMKPKDFWSFIKTRLDKSRPLWVFSHNLGFDLTVVNFWKTVECERFHIENFVIDDPPTFFVCKWNGSKIFFVDTLNYWRVSLAMLGKSLGIEKIQMPPFNSDFQQWKIYCEQDVKIIEQAIFRLIDYIKRNHLGGFGLSTPSIAFKAFCKRFMKHDIFIHDNYKICRLERDAYYGGRVNCFFLGKAKRQKYFKLDVNSLYPYVMLNNFPVKLIRHGEEISIKELLSLSLSFGIVAKVFIDDIKHAFVRRYQNRLCEVIGKYHTTLCGPELIRALSLGSVKKIFEFAIYQMKPIFRDYVNFFWNERQKFKLKNDDVSQNMTKIFLNSLYGKFGQNGWSFRQLSPEILYQFYQHYNEKWDGRYLDEKKLPSLKANIEKWFPFNFKKPVILRRIGDNTEIRFPEEEYHSSFPLISAYVTSYAREYHRELIEKTGKQQTLYVDTDSLIVTQKGFERLNHNGFIHQSLLGKCKIEDRTSTIEIFQPKHYTFGNERICKGIRRNSISLGSNSYYQLQFEGIKGVLRCNGKPSITIKRIVKSLKLNYSKGKKTYKGWTTPFHLNEKVDELKVTK